MKIKFLFTGLILFLLLSCSKKESFLGDWIVVKNGNVISRIFIYKDGDNYIITSGSLKVSASLEKKGILKCEKGNLTLLQDNKLLWNDLEYTNVVTQSSLENGEKGEDLNLNYFLGSWTNLDLSRTYNFVEIRNDTVIAQPYSENGYEYETRIFRTDRKNLEFYQDRKWVGYGQEPMNSFGTGQDVFPIVKENRFRLGTKDFYTGGSEFVKGGVTYY